MTRHMHPVEDALQQQLLEARNWFLATVDEPRIDQRGKALGLLATRALVVDRFDESRVAPVRNASVHAADWPGADDSSCLGQTSRLQESEFGLEICGHSLQVTGFKAEHRHCEPD